MLRLREVHFASFGDFLVHNMGNRFGATLVRSLIPRVVLLGLLYWGLLGFVFASVSLEQFLAAQGVDGACAGLLLDFSSLSGVAGCYSSFGRRFRGGLGELGCW